MHVTAPRQHEPASRHEALHLVHFDSNCQGTCALCRVPPGLLMQMFTEQHHSLQSSIDSFEGHSEYVESLHGPLAQIFKDKDKLPRRVKFQWVEGDPASVDALTKARLSQAQALIIGGSSTAQPKEADAFTLTTITLAQASAPPWLLRPDHHDIMRPVHHSMWPSISS